MTVTTDDLSGTEALSLREQKKSQTRTAIHDAAMHLVLEHGLNGVTIDEICARAEISTRTFFNYFSSKTAAVIGLEPPAISDEVRAAFLTRTGRDHVIDDLCVLVAQTVPTSRPRVRDLIEKRPELAGPIHAWMADLRDLLTSVTSERVDPRTARLAVALVMASVMEVVKSTEITPARPDFVSAVQGTVRDMLALASD